MFNTKNEYATYITAVLRAAESFFLLVAQLAKYLELVWVFGSLDLERGIECSRLIDLVLKELLCSHVRFEI